MDKGTSLCVKPEEDGMGGARCALLITQEREQYRVHLDKTEAIEMARCLYVGGALTTRDGRVHIEVEGGADTLSNCLIRVLGDRIRLDTGAALELALNLVNMSKLARMLERNTFLPI